MSKSKGKAAMSSEDAERRLRGSAPASRYSGTIARGMATGPDPFVSDLRRRVARGEKFPKKDEAVGKKARAAE